jgi:hypothetical protein
MLTNTRPHTAVSKPRTGDGMLHVVVKTLSIFSPRFSQGVDDGIVSSDVRRGHEDERSEVLKAKPSNALVWGTSLSQERSG